MRRACRDCIFWDYLWDHNQTPIGKCRALPPRPDKDQGCAFPVTEAHDWCARFTSEDPDPATLLDALP